MKKRGEISLGSPVNNELKKGKIKTFNIFLIIGIAAIVIILGILFYYYMNGSFRSLNYGANIERADIGPDLKSVYLKLNGGINYGNITDVNFIFKDDSGKEYSYETNDGISEISIPYKTHWWNIFIKPKFLGSYDYTIISDKLGIPDFTKITEVDVVFKYKTISGTEVVTPTITTKKPTLPKPTTSGSSGGGGGSGGGGNPNPVSCINECPDSQNICYNNISYNCILETDGCYHLRNPVGCLGGTCINGTCENITIICNNNTECGTDIYIGNSTCYNNSIYQNYTSFICSSPGNQNSSCSNSTSFIEKQGCISNQTCLNVECILPSCTPGSLCRASTGECDIAEYYDDNCSCPVDSYNSTGTSCSINKFCNGTGGCVICNMNSNCGVNSLIGNLFCSSGNLFQNYTTYTCNNPGTLLSSCSSSISSQLNQSCGVNSCNSFGSNYCKPDGNVYHNQTCYSSGCNSGSCFSNPSINETLVQTCNSTQTCNSGVCNNIPIICSTNSNCGVNGWIGNPICNGNNVFQNYINYTCNNPGLINSYCTNSTNFLLKQTCTNCNNGACVCSPSCLGKSCGSDGCSGSCGNCGTGMICNASFMCETHNVSSAGWYSFEKDSDNSKIADSDIAPPFRLKYTADASLPWYPGYGPFFLARDGLLFSVVHSSGSGLSIYRGIYNLSTGKKLFSTIDNAISYYGDNYQAKSEALINEYLIGTDTHYNEFPFEVNSGLQAPNIYLHPDATNVDPVNNIYVTQGWVGTDTSGYEISVRDLSNSAGPQPDPNGKFNGGFKFEKNGWQSFEYIDLGKRSSPYNRIDTNTQLNPGSSNWTIMLWFKWDGIVRSPDFAPYSNEVLFTKGGPGGYGLYGLYQAILNNGTVVFSTNYVNVGNNSFNCAPNEWCNLAVTYDHKKIIIYKNGVEVSEQNETRDLGSSQDSLYLGGVAGDWGDGFGGLIDEFAMFNRSLATEEIASKYNSELTPDSSTVVLMHFNNDSSHGENNTFVYDSSGNNNNGISVWHHFDKSLWDKSFCYGWNGPCTPKGPEGIPGIMPIIHNGIVYTNDGKLYASNETNTLWGGQLLWQQGYNFLDTVSKNITLGEIINSGLRSNINSGEMVYSDGLIYSMGSEATNITNDCNNNKNSLQYFPCSNLVIIGYNATNGEMKVHSDLTNLLSLGAPFSHTIYTTTPYYLLLGFVIKNNTAFIKIDKRDESAKVYTAIITAINLSNNNVLWKTNISDYSPSSQLRNSQQMALSGNVLFVSAKNIVAINTTNGEKIWEFADPELNPYYHNIFPGLIVQDNTLFIGTTEGKVYAFEQGYENPEIINNQTQLDPGMAGTLYKAKYIEYGNEVYYANYSFQVIGGQFPYNWQIVSGRLPNGLSLVNDSENYNENLVGTPSESGDFNFTVQVKDSHGNSDEKQFFLRIIPDSKILSIDLQQGFNNYSGCQDSGIDGWGPCQNFISGNYSIIGSGCRPGFELTEEYNTRGLLKFKIFNHEGGPVPDDAIITSANLTFYKNDPYSHVVSAYKLLKNWNEMEVSWNNASQNETWFTPGVDEIGIDRTQELINFTTRKCPVLTPNWCEDRTQDWNFSSGFYNYDITPLVSGYDSGETNYGWLFTQPSQGALRIASCDNSNLILRPKLTINYKRFNPDNVAPKMKLYVNPTIVLNGTMHQVFAEAYDNTNYIYNNIFVEYYQNASTYSGDPDYSWNVTGTHLNCTYSSDKTYLNCTNNMILQSYCLVWMPNICYNTQYFYLSAYDEYGLETSRSILVNIVNSFNKTTITTTMLRDGVIGTAYSDNVYVEGNTSIASWSIDSGNLPPGLSLDSNSGIISGTPSAFGVYNFRVKVSSGADNIYQNLSISVYDENGGSCGSCEDVLTYNVTDLGTLGGPWSQGWSINNNGQVVGFTQINPPNAWYAFLYNGGAMQDLGLIGGRNNEFIDAEAFAINNNGQIAGYSEILSPLPPYTPHHPFIYSNGTMQDLGTFNGNVGEAYGINNNGQVVGYSTLGGYSRNHAFLYSNGTMQDLGTFGGNISEAYGINDNGQVVGDASTNANLQHAFLYSNGTMQDLGTLGGNISVAFGINNNAQIVGYSTINGYDHAFLYSNGTMQDLGTLGGNISEAHSINDNGQVVGKAETDNAIYHAFVYNNNKLIDLNNLANIQGWTLQEANDINDLGQIVGTGRNPSGQQHAFLLTPVYTITSSSTVSGSVASLKVSGNLQKLIIPLVNLGFMKYVYALILLIVVIFFLFLLYKSKIYNRKRVKKSIRKKRNRLHFV